MNQWILGLIIRLLKEMLTDDMLDDLKAKFVAWLREMAQDSENKLDDALVDIIEKLLS